jgi:DNA-damage-inducible protein J
MTNTINVTIRLDRDIKERAESLFDDFGMNLSTAFNIFVRQALRQGKIPFEIYDPFYSEENMAELSRRVAEINAGTALLTPHDLIEVEDEFEDEYEDD